MRSDATGPYLDLREYLAALEHRELLCTVAAEVDWDCEVGAIARIMLDRHGPALKFTAVRDSPHALVTSVLATPERYALGLGCEPTMRAIIEYVSSGANRPITPVISGEGVCQEHVVPGDRIDLFSLPVPKWHELDGGRYLGTLGVVIARDPETGARNAGIYRQQIIDRNTTAIQATQQFGILMRKYRALGRPMPVATVIGLDPCTIMAACLQARLGEDELAAAGGLIGRPLELVRCVTQELEVPARAEFVFEGEIRTDAPLVDEGPFGEYTGYYGQATKSPEIHLTAMTHRSDPIFQGTLEGAPPSESTMLRVPGSSAALTNRLKSMRTPGVKDVYMTDMGCVSYMVVISIDRANYHGYVRQVIAQVWAHDIEAKWVIVVDDDIDVYDRGQVEWALATRVMPHRDIWITPPNQPGQDLDPAIPQHERSNELEVRASRIGIDATTGFKGFEFEAMARPQNTDAVLARWPELGLP